MAEINPYEPPSLNKHQNPRPAPERRVGVMTILTLTPAVVLVALCTGCITGLTVIDFLRMMRLNLSDNELLVVYFALFTGFPFIAMLAMIAWAARARRSY
jgi:hypothetical protein